MLVALVVLVENLAFELPLAGSVSLTFAVSFAAMLYSGPVAGVVCSLAGAYTYSEYRSRKAPALSLYNAGQLTLSAGLSGLSYVALGGPILAVQRVTTLGTSLVIAAVSAAVFYVVNVTSVAYAVSVLTDQSLRAVLARQGFLRYGTSLLVLALLGLLMAHLLALGSWIGLALLVLPFALARRTFRVYLELSEAYTSTVRSLVAAIEAKDPYTRGHSERVAILSRALAERTGLPAAEIDLVERAALLHDVGKIGVRLSTLTSADSLSAEEVREIRSHPTIGSALLESVEFLQDVVPVVRHHHEHVDGAGYPDGLTGEEIPLLARLLATADAYDAMTSDRAYRGAMTEERAIAEMRRVSGQQLDAAMVERLISIITEQAQAS
jgi:putative nucleotidyltransferase with HDIG domain